MISTQNYAECRYVNYVNRQVEQFSIGIILQPTIRLATYLSRFYQVNKYDLMAPLLHHCALSICEN